MGDILTANFMTGNINPVLAIASIILIFLIIDAYLPPFICDSESMTDRPLFGSKSDKAEAIAEYYNGNRGQINYIDYRRALSGGSNIVEYYYITQFARQRPQITVAEIVTLI